MSQPDSSNDAPAPTDDAITRHREELKKRFPLPAPGKRTRRPAAGTLSVLASTLALAGGLLWLDPAYHSEEFASTPGQLKTIELADGSWVTLDGASRIQVSWHLRTRQVELHSGQALFDVAPAQYRPFLTLAGTTEIRVVGTRYNVSRVRGDVRIAVAEGKVDVRGSDTSVRLTPGEQVLVRAGQLGSTTQVNSYAVAAWTEGRLVFERTPLGEVLDVLQRYQGTTVQLDDAALAQLPVSGTFDSARLDGLLALLPKILPVELSTDTKGVLSLKQRTAEK